MKTNVPVHKSRAARLLRRWLSRAIVLVGITALSTPAQTLGPSDVELEDVISIEVLDRFVLAFDMLGGGSRSFQLEIGEEIIWLRATGRLGVVVTDRRLMGVSADRGSWTELRYLVHESRPERVLTGTRVALTLTDRRIIGYDTHSASWLVRDIGPHEVVKAARVGAGTAVVVTDRKAYGFSPDAGGFLDTPMRIHEKLDGVRVSANLATVNTSKRILVFRAPAGTWTVERRPLN
jgi:hypothetical protein